MESLRKEKQRNGSERKKGKNRESYKEYGREVG